MTKTVDPDVFNDGWQPVYCSCVLYMKSYYENKIIDLRMYPGNTRTTVFFLQQRQFLK